MSARARGLTVVVAAFVLLSACSPSPGPGTKGVLAPPPAALPDVSKLAASVQAQLQERHAALTALVATRPGPVELANSYGEMGKLLMAAQFPDAPEAYLLEAQRQNASDPRWPYYLAQLYRSRGQSEKSLAQFARSSALNPDDVASQVWLGDTYLQLGQPDAAEPRFAAALALQPSSVSARFGLGRAALARNDYRGAVVQFEDVLTRDPKAAAVHYPLSLAYAALGDRTKADEHLRQRANHEILPADPLMVELETLLESPQTYETQGIRALEKEDWTGAASWFRKGLGLAPENAALHQRLGAALGAMGDAGAARQQFEEAVRLAPDQFLAHYSLGVMEQQAGRHEAAIAKFSAALLAQPNYPQAQVRLASSLRRTRRAREALSAYERALADAPELVEARLGYAMTLVQLGRYREARDRFDAARKPGGEVAPFTHGLARLLATAPDAAVRDGARAMTLVQELLQRGRTLDLGETMAMTLAELGEFDRAAAVQRDLVTASRQAGLAPVTARLAANLSRYERRLPCRTPWTEDEMP